MLLTFENLSRILRLKPASQPLNLRAKPQKLERVTRSRSIFDSIRRLSRKQLVYEIRAVEVGFKT